MRYLVDLLLFADIKSYQREPQTLLVKHLKLVLDSLKITGLITRAKLLLL